MTAFQPTRLNQKARHADLMGDRDRKMADRNSLKFIGFLYGGFTALVMIVTGIVVGDHLSGRLSLDQGNIAIARKAGDR